MTTVFTNGCFDLLHYGHVWLLQQCRLHGDRVIVGLNSDASVRRLKGPSRPVFCLEHRAAILQELRCVDEVCVFDEDTPELLIQRIRPDVLIKGSGYDPATVVGAEFVRSYGGRVLVLTGPEISTTRIIDEAIERGSDRGR